jgi:hypothetical protein
MGARGCDIHGISGGIYVCEHIFHQFFENSDKVVSKIKFSSLTIIENLIYKFFLFPAKYVYCSLCPSKYWILGKKYSIFNHLLFHFSSFNLDKSKTKGVCIDCFYERVFNIKLGLSDDALFLNSTQKITEL